MILFNSYQLLIYLNIMARPLPVDFNSFEGAPSEQSSERVVSRVEISSQDGLVIYREIYEDGTPGYWERTGKDVLQSRVVIDELTKKYGKDKLPGGEEGLPR